MACCFPKWLGCSFRLIVSHTFVYMTNKPREVVVFQTCLAVLVDMLLHLA